jgi:type IV pilus biogenesis protein CpaD/CtpE
MPKKEKSGKHSRKKALTPLEILERIKGGISREAAEKWCAEIRRERRASGIRRNRMLEKAWAALGLKY